MTMNRATFLTTVLGGAFALPRLSAANTASFIKLFCWFHTQRKAEECTNDRGNDAEVRVYDSRENLVRTFIVDT